MDKLGNVSSAVMQQRHEPLDSLDDFPTPPWATRAFIAEALEKHGVDVSRKSVWEPACNRGYMARPLAEKFARVYATDIADYGWTGQEQVHDFLNSNSRPTSTLDGVDWIITNPPFVLGVDFVRRAFEVAREGVAMIVRSAFLEGGERHDSLFAPCMPWLVKQHVERVPMVRGRYDPQASTATSYSWVVWRRDWSSDNYLGGWIPKCRDRYERADDVNFEQKDGRADFVAQAIADSPLFAHEGGR